MTDIRRALHAAIDELSVSDIATFRLLTTRSTAPNALVWFLEIARSIARAAEEGNPLSLDVVVTMRCPDCLGPTSCDCHHPLGEELDGCL